MASKGDICDSCHRYGIPHGALCEACEKDLKEMANVYNRLLEHKPELKGKTMSQVFLQLARAYVLSS